MKIPKHAVKPVAALLAAGLLGGLWLWTLQPGGQSTLAFTGSVEAEQIDISPEIAGTLQTLAVSDGETVRQGQLLLTLDTAEYDLKLEMARSALRMAQLSAEDVADGGTDSQVRQARASAEAVAEQAAGAAAELEYLKKELERQKSLYDSGAASQQQLEAAERALEKGQAAYLALLKQKASQEALLAQVREGATRQARSAAEEQVRLKELEVKDLERIVSKGQLTSPLDGLVQSVNYEAGERLAPGQRAVTLLDMSRLEVKVYVPEKQLHRVAQGMAVQFTDDFLKDRGVTGTIRYISGKAEFTPKNIESKENKQEMVYEVRVAIEDPSGLVKPGMFLDVLLQEGGL